MVNITHLFRLVSHALLQNRCVLCHSHTPGSQSLCAGCKLELPKIETACARCAMPMALSSTPLICGQCISAPPPMARTFALCHYQSPVRTWVTDLKFQAKLFYGKLIGQCLAESFDKNVKDFKIPEVLLPMPLHPKRLHDRGF